MYAYLGSPYTDPDPFIMESRYILALRATCQLMREGTTIFSPVVHCHELSKIGGLPKDLDFWWEFDRNMLLPAAALYVLCIDGWECSRGVKREMEFAEEMNIPVGLIVGGYSCHTSVQMVHAQHA